MSSDVELSLPLCTICICRTTCLCRYEKRNTKENTKFTVWQVKQLGGKLLEEFVLERRFAGEPGARHELEQLGREVLRVTDVVQARERVPQPLRPVKVQPLRLVQGQARHARPSSLRRRAQHLEDAIQLIPRVLHARERGTAGEQLDEDAAHAPQICNEFE